MWANLTVEMQHSQKAQTLDQTNKKQIIKYIWAFANVNCDSPLNHYFWNSTPLTVVLVKAVQAKEIAIPTTSDSQQTK